MHRRRQAEELLDLTETDEDDDSEEEDSNSLLDKGSTELLDTLVSLLLDRGMTEEDDTLLLDSLVSLDAGKTDEEELYESFPLCTEDDKQRELLLNFSSILEDESSSGRTTLLSSSQATKQKHKNRSTADSKPA